MTRESIYFTMRFSPHFQLLYFTDRLEFCEFFEWKIKRINNADLFSQRLWSYLPMVPILVEGTVRSNFICILNVTSKYKQTNKQNKTVFPGKSKAEYFCQINTWQIYSKSSIRIHPLKIARGVTILRSYKCLSLLLLY